MTTTLGTTIRGVTTTCCRYNSNSSSKNSLKQKLVEMREGEDLTSHLMLWGGGNMRDTRARRDQAANPQKVALIAAASDAVNDKAVQVLTRVSCKLSGLDFPTITDDSLAVEAQVELLIQQTISHENLCQSFVGWCPFW